MSCLVPIARAARALGVDRTNLRRRIDSAGIVTFEGSVDLDELRRVAPTFGFDEAEVIERTRLIRENAKAMRHDPRAPQPTDDLALQARRLTVDLLVEKRRVERLQGVVNGLLHRLEELQVSTDPARRGIALDLNAWLAEKLAVKP